MNNSTFPTARKAGLVIQEVPDEVLIFDLETNKAHCLNETAALVWKSCDGKNSVSDITKYLAATTGSKVSDDLVWLAIDQLNENRLLETRVKSGLAGTSRRDALKKIGLASMIAIPVVASLVAPQNALAAVSCVCGSSNDCTMVGLGNCTSMDCCNEDGVCAPDLGGGCAP